MKRQIVTKINLRKASFSLCKKILSDSLPRSMARIRLIIQEKIISSNKASSLSQILPIRITRQDSQSLRTTRAIRTRALIALIVSSRIRFLPNCVTWGTWRTLTFRSSASLKPIRRANRRSWASTNALSLSCSTISSLTASRTSNPMTNKRKKKTSRSVKTMSCTGFCLSASRHKRSMLIHTSFKAMCWT